MADTTVTGARQTTAAGGASKELNFDELKAGSVSGKDKAQAENMSFADIKKAIEAMRAWEAQISRGLDALAAQDGEARSKIRNIRAD